VWIRKGKRPICLVTGSHKKVTAFGALTLSGKQIFRTTNEKFDWKSTLEFLYLMKNKFRKFVLFWDKASPHKDDMVRAYLRKNKHCIRVVRFPTAAPELNPVEECWRQTKGEFAANKIYETFKEFHKHLSRYCRKKRFRLNIRNYLCD
jgi:transposase